MLKRRRGIQKAENKMQKDPKTEMPKEGNAGNCRKTEMVGISKRRGCRKLPKEREAERRRLKRKERRLTKDIILYRGMALSMHRCNWTSRLRLVRRSSSFSRRSRSFSPRSSVGPPTPNALTGCGNAPMKPFKAKPALDPSAACERTSRKSIADLFSARSATYHWQAQYWRRGVASRAPHRDTTKA